MRAPFVIAMCIVGAGCGSPTTPTRIDLGPPRQLVYVADDVGAAKHGGASSTESLIHVFEADTYARVGSFAGGQGVGELHATPDGSIVWIVATSEGTVSLFDTTTYEILEFEVGVKPVHSFITPSHDAIWVGNDVSSDVSVISLESRAVIGTVLTGAGHHKMAMVPGAAGLDTVYVSNIIDGSITPVGSDLVARTNVAGSGPAPHGMDFSFVTRRVYNCSGDAAHDVEAIATTDEVGTAENDRDTVVARIALPSRCTYLRVSDDGHYAYATLPTTNQLARVHFADHQLDLYDTASAPDRFAVIANFAYVGHAGSPTVSVIDLDGIAPTFSIPVGNAQAPGVVAGGSRLLRLSADRLFVPNAYDGTVTVIDTADNSVLATLDGMHAPFAVAVAGPGYGTTYPR